MKVELSTHNKGTIGELRVEIDLLSKGYHVFRSASPACPCDIVAIKKGQCIKIEVRTMKERGLDKGDINPYWLKLEHEPGFVDWFAFVFRDGIVYCKTGDTKPLRL